MKRLIPLLMLALTVSASFAQTTVDPRDTVIFKPAVYSPEKYTPAQYIPATFTPSSYTPATFLIKPYKAPVTSPVENPPVNTGAGSVAVGGIISAPVVCKSNTTYSGLTIDLKGTANVGFTLNNVTNVHIINCKIINGTSFGILINSGKSITIENSFLSNIGFGIYAQGNSQTIKVINNQILNVNGINTSSLGHAIQFNGVTGNGNQINYNRIENTAMLTNKDSHPHDVINVYKSSGLANDSLQVIGNWIRGGQLSLWPTSGSGAAGIVIGDLGGSYQVCRNNILVNPGYVGIQAQGGNHIMVDHNTIYSSSTPASLVGMSWGNYSGTTSSDVTYAYNKVKWFNLRNLEDDAPSKTSGLVEIKNIWGANIDASILPATIITMK